MQGQKNNSCMYSLPNTQKLFIFSQTMQFRI